jgi:hypothetical protein
VSENVAAIISSLGLNIDVDTASNLMYGISEATDNFQNPKTSPLAFETTAILMKKGAKRTMRNATKTFDAIDRDPFFEATLPKKPEVKTEKKRDDNPPDDCLAPKIYKGSTAI